MVKITPANVEKDGELEKFLTAHGGINAMLSREPTGFFADDRDPIQQAVFVQSVVAGPGTATSEKLYDFLARHKEWPNGT